MGEAIEEELAVGGLPRRGNPLVKNSKSSSGLRPPPPREDKTPVRVISIGTRPSLLSSILIITKNYPPAVCGVGDHTMHLRRELEGLGNKVVVVTGTDGQKGENVFSVDRFDGSMYPVLNTLVRSEKIEQVLWQYVPYSYQLKGLPFWWPVLMMRLSHTRVKQYVFFHEVSVRLRGYGSRQMIGAMGQRIIANLTSLCAKNCFTSICLFAGYFLFKKPVIVPISANIMSTVNGQRSTVDNLQVFCFANRADRALLGAVQRINERIAIKLILGGAITPSKKTWLEQEISERKLNSVVHFTGILPQEELAERIVESAIFIQPQMVERKTQGGVSAKNGTVMAAMAMGKAIISCEGDMTDASIFKDGVNMMMVGYGDAEEYERAMMRLLQDSKLVEQLGVAAAATYEEKCSWAVTGKMIADGMNPGGIPPSLEFGSFPPPPPAGGGQPPRLH